MVLTPTDAQGKALAADTAEVAPADAVIPEGQALKLQLSWNSSSTGTVVLFVNGRSVATATISSYGTITLDVPADALTASVGEKNVLEVKISQYDSVIDSDYITVLETE